MNPTEEVIKQTGHWAQHGLPGLVIASLFALVFWLIHSYSKKEAQNAAEQKEERLETRRFYETQNTNLEMAFKELSSAIRQTKDDEHRLIDRLVSKFIEPNKA